MLYDTSLVETVTIRPVIIKPYHHKAGYIHTAIITSMYHIKDPHKEVSHPMFLCYATASTLHVPFLIDFSCAILKSVFN